MSHSLNDTSTQGFKVFLQSKDATILRDEGSTAFFFLNKVLAPPAPNMNMMVGVIDVEIPVSYYNINNNNNTVTINGIEMSLENQNYSAFNNISTLLMLLSLAIVIKSSFVIPNLLPLTLKVCLLTQ